MDGHGWVGQFINSMIRQTLQIPGVQANSLPTSVHEQSLSPISDNNIENASRENRRDSKFSRSSHRTSQGNISTPPTSLAVSRQDSQSPCRSAGYRSNHRADHTESPSMGSNHSIVMQDEVPLATPPIAQNKVQASQRRIVQQPVPLLRLENGSLPEPEQDLIPRSEDNDSQDASLESKARPDLDRMVPNMPVVEVIDMHRLQYKQQETLMLRIRARDKRNQLDLIHDDILSNDALITQCINRWTTLHETEDLMRLNSLLETSQAAREEYRSSGLEYADMEARLNRMEWELKEELSAMFAKINPQYRDFDMDAREIPPAVRREHSSEPDEPIPPPPEHSGDLHSHLNNRYLSREGDAYLIEEQINELVNERMHILSAQQRLQRVGQGLNEDDQNFLHTFESRIRSLHEDLARIQEDLAQIQDLIDSHSDTLFQNGQFGALDVNPADDVLMSDSDLVQESKNEEHSEDQYESISTFLYSVKEDWYNNVYQFVNRWLLNLLHNSIVQLLVLCLSEQQKLGTTITSMKELKAIVLQESPDIRAQRIVESGGPRSQRSTTLNDSEDNFDAAALDEKTPLAARSEMAPDTRDVFDGYPALEAGFRGRETTSNSLLRRALGAMARTQPSGPHTVT